MTTPELPTAAFDLLWTAPDGERLYFNKGDTIPLRCDGGAFSPLPEPDVFDQVRKFWEIGHTEKLAERPAMPSEESLQLCLRLIREERLELLDAVNDGDLVEMADALGDIIYVTVGMGLACGFPMREIFDEIHRSNMDKFPGGVVTRRPSDGKVMKPEGWTKPDIKGILARATARATVHIPQPETPPERSG